MIDKTTIAKNFSRAASTYETYAQLQQFAATKLATIVAETCDPALSTVFEVGCGTGKLTRELAKVLSNAQLVASDISQEMLNVCRTRISNEFDRPARSRFDFQIQDAETLALTTPVDLIASGLTLQWLDLEHCLETWWKNTDAIAFSTLTDGTLQPWADALGSSGRTVDAENDSRLLTFLSQERIMAICEQLQPAKLTSKSISWSQRFDSVTAFLRSLKGVGAHAAADNRADATSLRRAMRKFDSEFVANYELAFYVLQK